MYVATVDVRDQLMLVARRAKDAAATGKMPGRDVEAAFRARAGWAQEQVAAGSDAEIVEEWAVRVRRLVSAPR